MTHAVKARAAAVIVLSELLQVFARARPLRASSCLSSRLSLWPKYGLRRALRLAGSPMRPGES